MDRALSPSESMETSTRGETPNSTPTKKLERLYFQQATSHGAASLLTRKQGSFRCFRPRYSAVGEEALEAAKARCYPRDKPSIAVSAAGTRPTPENPRLDSSQRRCPWESSQTV